MKVLVVGGGASGMMAAINASIYGAEVTLYERNSSLGKKILATGNGKCNITNLDLSYDNYFSEDKDEIATYFNQFDNEATISLFKSFGLLLKNKGVYVYPASEQASTVRDVLELRLLEHKVKVVLGITINSITKQDSIFVVNTDNGTDTFDRVILACGSYAGLRKNDRISSDKDGYSLAYHLGHSIIPVKPALTQLVCEADYLKDIAGVRCEGKINLLKNDIDIASDYGELQFTEYGISGIPTFQISRYVARDIKSIYKVSIDLLPNMEKENLQELLQSRILVYMGAKVGDYFLGLFNSKINSLIIKLLGLTENDLITDDNKCTLMNSADIIKGLIINIKSAKSFENAQCCSGGVPLSELDDKLQSKKCSGLYIIGEMVDVDGKCGGYNLQWAWTTGYIAGKSAVR